VAEERGGGEEEEEEGGGGGKWRRRRRRRKRRGRRRRRGQGGGGGGRLYTTITTQEKGPLEKWTLFKQGVGLVVGTFPNIILFPNFGCQKKYFKENYCIANVSVFPR
jgi:hypothetical protein